MQNLSKYTSAILYLLLAVAIAVFAMFFTGGYVDADAEYLEPIYTDLVLNLSYIVIAVGLVFTVVFAAYQFIMQLMDAPMKALGTLASIGAFAALLFVSWSVGSGEPLAIPGYEGTQNVYFWLKLTDMWMYSAGFLLAASVVSIGLFSLLKLVRR